MNFLAIFCLLNSLLNPKIIYKDDHIFLLSSFIANKNLSDEKTKALLEVSLKFGVLKDTKIANVSLIEMTLFANKLESFEFLANNGADFSQITKKFGTEILIFLSKNGINLLDKNLDKTKAELFFKSDLYKNFIDNQIKIAQILINNGVKKSDFSVLFCILRYIGDDSFKRLKF